MARMWITGEAGEGWWEEELDPGGSASASKVDPVKKPATSTLAVDRPGTTEKTGVTDTAGMADDYGNISFQNGANMGPGQPGGGGNLAVQAPKMGATDTAGMADFQPPAPVTTPPPSYLDIESQLPYDAGPPPVTTPPVTTPPVTPPPATKTETGKGIGESSAKYQESPTNKGLDKEYTEIIGEEDINALIEKFESNIASGTVGDIPSLPTIKVTQEIDGKEVTSEEELIYGQERDPYTGGPSGLEGYGYIEKVPSVRPQTQEVDIFTHDETGESLSLAQLKRLEEFALSTTEDPHYGWDQNWSDVKWMDMMRTRGVPNWTHSVETLVTETPVLDQFGKQTFDEKFVITAATQAAGAAYERSLELLDIQRDFVQKQQASVNQYEREKLFEEFRMEIRDKYSEIEQERANTQADLDREDRQSFEFLQEGRGQRFVKSEREASQEYQDEVREWEKQTAKDIADYEREQNITFNESERAAIDEWEKQKFEREFAARSEFETDERKATQTWQDEQRVAEEDFRRTEAQLDRDLTTDERVASENWQRTLQLDLDLGRREHEERMYALRADADRQAAEVANQRQLDMQTIQNSVDSYEALLGRNFKTGEREAAEAYATAASALENTRRVVEREDMQTFTSGERIAGQEFQTEERATERAWQEQEADLTRQFQTLRDTTDFNRTSLLESARLGIADATSPEGIARAVELANTARDREKTLAALDVIERIASNPQAAFALSNSGLLGALGTEFGLDLSFIGEMTGTQSVLSGNLLPPASDFARMPIDQQRAQLNAISAATGVSPEDIRLEIIRRAQGGGLATGSDAYATRVTV